MTNKPEDYHITNLQPFDFDHNKFDLKEVANADQGAIDIDHISEYKCNTTFLKRVGLYITESHGNLILLSEDAKHFMTIRDLLIDHTLSLENSLIEILKKGRVICRYYAHSFCSVSVILL